MRLTITNAEGTIILVVNLDDYDLTHPHAAAALLDQICDVVARAKWTN